MSQVASIASTQHTVTRPQERNNNIVKEAGGRPAYATPPPRPPAPAPSSLPPHLFSTPVQGYTSLNTR